MRRFDCRTVQGWLYEPDGADGLPDDIREGIRMHLALCEECREIEHLLSVVGQSAGHDPLPRLPPLVQRRLMSGMAASGTSAAASAGTRSSSPVAAVIRRWPTTWLAVVATVLVAGAATVVIVSRIGDRGRWSDDRPADGAVAQTGGGVGEARAVSAVDGGSPADPLVGESTLADGPGSEIRGDVATGDGPGLGASTSTVASDRTGLDSGSGIPDRLPPAADPEAARQAIDEGRLDDAAELVLEQVRRAPDSPETIETLACLAQAQRRARRYDEAAGTYGKLIELYPDSEAAGASHVGLGQMKLDAMGLTGESMTHFDDYLAHQPTGALAEEARVGRVRAMAQMGRHADVLAASEEYLAFHTDGVAYPEVLRYRGDAYRAGGDCERAIRCYDRVVESWPDSPYAAWARVGLEACASVPGVAGKGGEP